MMNPLFIFCGNIQVVFTKDSSHHSRYKHYERWATANDFPVENVVNDGSTTLEDRLGAVADLELAIRSRHLHDDIMVVWQEVNLHGHSYLQHLPCLLILQGLYCYWLVSAPLDCRRHALL